ncbi:MAG: fibronectin type III-like domain-contianing protein, partial [Firmicutes bacterium]|nr:fibronectin type III-like domain-contianing protein [Bacillota bacterium]
EKTEDTVEVEVCVTNTGSVASDEVAELYLQHESPNTTTPRWSLKGFKRITLAPGESKQVRFVLKPQDLWTVQDDGSRILEPGRYTVYVGGGQPDARTQALQGQAPLSAEFYMD